MTGNTEKPAVFSADVQADQGGARLDRWLASHIPDLSRARLQALIRDGQVRRGSETIREASARVKPGETYVVDVPPAADADIGGEDVALTVVYEDRDVIVIDKPAGLVVHPAAGHASGTLVNALVHHCGDSLSGIGGVKRPGIVHRIDKDTSGLLVVAKTDAAHQSLSDQFRSHGADGRLSRAYLALVWGVPGRPKGVIDVPLERSSANRTKIAVARADGGRHAITHYEVVETFDGPTKPAVASLLRLELETGRTHQIRVHMAHIGHPLLGDQTYGAGHKTRISTLSVPAQTALLGLNRQALHAAHLSFSHPRTGKIVRCDSALPPEMIELLDALKSGGRPVGPAAEASPEGEGGVRAARRAPTRPRR
ncbi:MAG: RluA family pseudouridine synthase [Hyphomicrobium sp.]